MKCSTCQLDDSYCTCEQDNRDTVQERIAEALERIANALELRGVNVVNNMTTIPAQSCSMHTTDFKSVCPNCGQW